MLNVPDEIKALLKQDWINKNFRVHFPDDAYDDIDNKNLEQESVVFTESLCSQQTFKFGLAEASQLEFTGVNIPNILGEIIECAIQVDCTSLGAQWATDHPYDPTLPWLTPQPYKYRYEKSGSGSGASGASIPINARYDYRNVTITSASDSYFYSVSISSSISPSNPVDLTGFTAADIIISPTNDPQDGYTYHIPFDVPLIYGTIDFLTGDYSDERKMLTDLATRTWTAVAGDTHTFQCDLPSGAPVVPATDSPNMYDYVCSSYFPVKYGNRNNYNYCYCVTGNPAKLVIRDIDHSNTSAANIAAFVSSLANVKLIYKSGTYTGTNSVVLVPPVVTGHANWNVWLTLTRGDGGTANTFSVSYLIYNYDDTMYYSIPYGRFEVVSCPRNHGQMAFRRVTAITRMAPFKGNQFVNGQYPTDTVKINPYDWLSMYVGQFPLEMEKAINTATSWWDIPKKVGMVGLVGGLPLYLRLSGVYAPECRIDFYSTPVGDQHPLKAYALKVQFEPSIMDYYADTLFNTALNASKPSGDYTKQYDSASGNTYGAFTNIDEELATVYGGLKPSFYIAAHYINGAANFYRISKPIIIEPDETYLLDLTHLDEFDYFITPTSSWSIATGSGQVSVSLYINVPCRWDNHGEWENEAGTTVSISNWTNGVPPLQDPSVQYIRRGGKDEEKYLDPIKVYLKEITSNTAVPRGQINATLAFNKTGLGTYYTFANAVSQIKMAEGIMEMTAEFLRVSREGELVTYKMSDHQTVIPVAASDWQEFWWDETDIDSIGTVEALIQEGEEEKSETFTIGTGNSVYVIDDNEALRKAGWSKAEIQQLFEGPFATEAAFANYTPVEMTMRGLPYLETGDKVQMTAEDGETVESYIMQQTISGIQHLTCSIVSMSGETMAVIEEE